MGLHIFEDDKPPHLGKNGGSSVLPPSLARQLDTGTIVLRMDSVVHQQPSLSVPEIIQWLELFARNELRG